MTNYPQSTPTWLGPLDEVQQRVRAELQRRLIVDQENGLVERPPTDESVIAMTQDVLAIHESIRPIFLKWWEQGTIDEETLFQGYSIGSLHRTLGLRNVMSTFTWLDGLVRNPEDAKRKIVEASKRTKVWRVRVEPLN